MSLHMAKMDRRYHHMQVSTWLEESVVRLASDHTQRLPPSASIIFLGSSKSGFHR